ncbi:ABC transporter ATP-binding protein [Nocardia sp. NPDC003963]
MSEAESKVLDIRGLRVTFRTDRGPVQAVGGVDLALAPGRIHALVGESGSGKSVTGSTVMGLTRGPRTSIEGEIRYAGTDLLQAGERVLRGLRGRELAMVFQDPMRSLNPMHRVGHQIAETIQVNAGLSRKDARAQAVEMLRTVGIRDPGRAARAYPHEFSGGMRQRVVIAIALACEPKVLVADEPTTALDVSIQAQILELMVSMARSMDTAVLLITHDLGVVGRYADDVSVIHDGEILERGPVTDVLTAPRHDYTKRLLAAIPRLRGPRRKFLTLPGGA